MSDAPSSPTAVPDTSPVTRRPWASIAANARDNNFDALRLLFALGVIVSHGWLLTSGPSPAGYTIGTVIDRWTRDQADLGGFCVHAFFCISGYLIAASWVNCRTSADYLLRRVRRIYPAYLVAVVVSLALAAAGGAGWRFTAGDAGRAAVDALLLQRLSVAGAFPNNPLAGVVNGSMWTIQYEFFCYLLVSAIGIAIGVRRRRAFIAGVVAILLLVGVIAVLKPALAQSVGHAMAVHWPQYSRLIAHFMAGAAFYVWRDRIVHSGAIAVAVVIAILVASRVPPALLFVSPMALTYLVMWAAYHPRVRLHRFGRHGDFSYGVYLYAYPFQQLLIHAGVATNAPLNIAVAVPVSLVCGALSWHGVEKWFIRSRRGRAIRARFDSRAVRNLG